ncbi:MAG: hypothetical protein HY314_00835 [Acidobacteria bacterium]|nr:hypothetical protein [Acidobacteriota bacterium]
MLDKYRSELAAFQEALGREYFLHHSGQKKALELYPIYDRYADLFTREAIKSLKDQLESTPDHFERQRQGIKLLVAFVEEHFIEKQAQGLTEQIAQSESQATLRFDSKEIPFYRAPEVLANEPDAQKRRSLTQQRIERVSESNELREERLRRLHETSRTLGYENYWAMATLWRGINLSSYADLAAQFLEHTESLYVRQMEERLPRMLGTSLAQADRADVEYFLQLNQYADFFPPDGAVAVYRETLKTLGISEERQKQVEIDDAQRPGKHRRSFCIPVRVPEEIKLSISLRGGPNDYQAMLHEGGHAQHYAWTSPSLPVEFKIAGDPAVAEGYAFLFQYLMLDPLWLDEMLHFGGSEDFIKLGWLHKLFYLRRYAAKLNYERDLHTSGDLAEASVQYAQRLTEATGFRYPAEDFLYDLNDHVYAANYFRGWLFEAQLREYLKTRFGKRWWKSARAADFLIDLWNTGESYAAEELALLVDLGPLSFDQLTTEFIEALKER